MKTLIIDAEDDVREIVRLSLQHAGETEVFECRTMDDGITIAQREQPDVVLLDIPLSDEAELDALRRFREGRQTAHIPLVFLTTRALSGEVERMQELGAHAILTKPFNPATLRDEIRAVLPPAP